MSHLCESEDFHEIIQETPRHSEKIGGTAFTECQEEENGYFVINNGEYAGAVNYCPFCGTSAPRQFQRR